MARPQKTGMDYFPHDTDACNDEKVELLRMLYGNDGYAFYFIMLERIYRTKLGELKIVSDSETKQNEIVYDEETIVILSKKIQISVELFEKILKTCLKRKIFCKKMLVEKGVLSSDGIKKRMKPILKKRSNMLKKYKNLKIVSAAETPQESGQKTPETSQKPDKEKERKGKKRKEKERIKNIAKKVIDYLNKKTGKKLRYGDNNLKNIIARINEKFSFDDFCKVIDIKIEDDHFIKNPQFLSPDTLFGSKFEKYLNSKSNITTNNGGIKHNGFDKKYYESGEKGPKPTFADDL